MNNDIQKSRPRKERWKGRKLYEEIFFIYCNVRCWLCFNQLRYTATVCRLATTTIFRNFRGSTNSYLANQKSPEMERIR